MSDLPQWLQPLAGAVEHAPAEYYSRFLPPPGAPDRQSAVLALFAEGPLGPDLLFIQRATTLRSHAGQPAFPGGKVDPEDDGVVAAALRECAEEVGLRPEGVEVFATLPPLYLPPSGFTVTTVLGWWRDPHDVDVVDPAEVAAVERVPIAELADPANRVEVRLRAEYTGPGFRVRNLLIWGFTAGLVDKLLVLGGWEQPWGPGPLVDRPAAPTEEGAADAIEEALRGS